MSGAASLDRSSGSFRHSERYAATAARYSRALERERDAEETATSGRGGDGGERERLLDAPEYLERQRRRNDSFRRGCGKALAIALALAAFAGVATFGFQYFSKYKHDNAASTTPGPSLVRGNATTAARAPAPAPRVQAPPPRDFRLSPPPAHTLPPPPAHATPPVKTTTPPVEAPTPPVEEKTKPVEAQTPPAEQKTTPTEEKATPTAEEKTTPTKEEATSTEEEKTGTLALDEQEAMKEARELIDGAVHRHPGNLGNSLLMVSFGRGKARPAKAGNDSPPPSAPPEAPESNEQNKTIVTPIQGDETPSANETEPLSPDVEPFEPKKPVVVPAKK